MLRAVSRFRPLLVLLAIELVWCSYLAIAHVVPAGHDGLQYFYLKHYVFSSVVRDGEFPLWLPYVTHGAPSAWWALLQSGIFDPIGLGAARLLRANDFFPIFYALLFAEKSLLVIGTWLFAGEHLKSRPALFTVTAAVSATAIWYTQPWWNFHAIVALPMMLFFLHRTLAAFRWVWVVALSLLFYLQTFGQPVYYLPMTLLFLAMYAVVAVAHREPASGRPRFSFSLIGVLATAAIVAALAAELLWFRRSAAEMAFGSTGRGEDGSVPLLTFLNYGGYTDLRMWNQLFSSLTPHLDFGMFAGFMVAGLAVVTCCSGPLNRVQRLFAWVSVGVVLVCSASPLSTLVYYFWPLARIFRHLSLLAPVAKFFVVLLAGAMLDRLLDPTDRPRISGRTVIVAVLVLGAWITILVMFQFNHERLQAFVAAMSTNVMLDSFVQVVGPRLGQAVALLGVTLIVLIGLLMSARRSAATPFWGWAAAAILLLDVTAYGLFEMRALAIPLARTEAPLFTLTNLPYKSRRIEVAESATNMRRETLRRVWRSGIGTRYWTENLLWQTDTYRSEQAAIYWSAALDTLLRTMSTTAALTPETLPPAGSRVLPVVGGLTASKTRLFTKAIGCPAPQTAHVLTSPDYRGQVAVLEVENGPSPALDWLPCEPGALPADAAGTDDAGTGSSVSFSSNRAEFDVTANGSKSAVLTYSDAWSPYWHASVNGNDAPIFRSDIAYKAVVVPPGKSRVIFEYRDRWGEYVFLLQALGSASFVVLLIVLGVRRLG